MIRQQNYNWKEMTVGTCYYPEHWEKKFWEEDIRRMKEIGISFIRIAEFAWNKFEPREGEFTFTFFDEFLNMCEETGMKVIMGTPTATPPAWLTYKYPEVLNQSKEGVIYCHGGRRHYNYNSPVYRKLAGRIVKKLAEHYGSHPAIVGWQIDNELNCEFNEFYSEADSCAFRVWARKKYGSLDALNEAWGTIFWNQTYTNWDEIFVPRPVNKDGINPHMYLDYYRFVSYSARSFCHMQAEIIRCYRKPGDFITTNGKFWNLDNHRMMDESLDVYTYDCYPNFAYALDPSRHANLDARHWSRHLIEVRSICRHFGIMEQQSGAGGWVSRMKQPSPRPGQLLLWAMQSVAQGADFVSFFRWRTCTVGTEIYWRGILDCDNRDNRKLAEVKDFCEKMRQIRPLCGSDYVSSFALIKDYDNIWDTNVDIWHREVAERSEEEIFVAAELCHTPYDMVFLEEGLTMEELAKYPVIFYPHPTIVDEKRVSLLRQYVEQGGILILGCLSGYKDMTGKCVMLPRPGLLGELTGTDIRDFTFAGLSEDENWAEWDGERLDVPVFHDIITPLGETRVLAFYVGSYYAGEAALTENQVGEGRVLHLGSTFSRKNVEQLLRYTGFLNPFSPEIEAPGRVQIIKRQKGDRSFYFVLNYQQTEEIVTLKRNMKLLYTGQFVVGEWRLPAFGTAVFEVM